MLPLWPLFPLLHLVLVLLGRFLGLLVVQMLFRRSWLDILLVRRLVLHGHDFLLRVLLEWWRRL
jgi:hypothetical protein